MFYFHEKNANPLGGLIAGSGYQQHDLVELGGRLPFFLAEIPTYDEMNAFVGYKSLLLKQSRDLTDLCLNANANSHEQISINIIFHDEDGWIMKRAKMIDIAQNQSIMDFSFVRIGFDKGSFEFPPAECRLEEPIEITRIFQAR